MVKFVDVAVVAEREDGERLCGSSSVTAVRTPRRGPDASAMCSRPRGGGERLPGRDRGPPRTGFQGGHRRRARPIGRRPGGDRPPLVDRRERGRFASSDRRARPRSCRTHCRAATGWVDRSGARRTGDNAEPRTTARRPEAARGAAGRDTQRRDMESRRRGPARGHRRGVASRPHPSHDHRRGRGARGRGGGGARHPGPFRRRRRFVGRQRDGASDAETAVPCSGGVRRVGRAHHVRQRRDRNVGCGDRSRRRRRRPVPPQRGWQRVGRRVQHRLHRAHRVLPVAVLAELRTHCRWIDVRSAVFQRHGWGDICLLW